jgi:uncharacterized protein
VSIADKVAGLHWPGIEQELGAAGCAITPPLLDADACATLRAAYGDDAMFRSKVVMGRHGFGSGEYKYFSYPLPKTVETLRAALYPRLVPVANRWEEMFGRERRFPDNHAEFVETCHAAGQARPTPLLLRYGPGDYNCLHQDIYGDEVFPLQVAILLSAPGPSPDGDFTGGEFVMTEQRPRMQSRAEVAPLRQGCGVIFAVNERPVRGTKGVYRARMRHGVSRIRSGSRYTLGVIFHDAA